MLGIAHPLPAGGARKHGRSGRWRGPGRGLGALGLEVEPFLQAGRAEGVQAVQEGERLVEEVGAYLENVGYPGRHKHVPWVMVSFC
jgi:hypothetical protein